MSTAHAARAALRSSSARRRGSKIASGPLDESHPTNDDENPGRENPSAVEDGSRTGRRSGRPQTVKRTGGEPGGKGESVDEGGDDVRDGRRVSSRAKKTRAMDGAEGRLENGDDRGAGREADALARAGGSEGGVGDARSLGDGLEEGEARDVDEGADAVGEDEGVRAGASACGGGSAMWTSTPSGMLMSASSGGQGARASVASREGATAGRDPVASSLLALVASGATRRGG